VTAAANTSHVDDKPQQTNQFVLPSRELKPPRAFAGIAMFLFILLI